MHLHMQYIQDHAFGVTLKHIFKIKYIIYSHYLLPHPHPPILDFHPLGLAASSCDLAVSISTPPPSNCHLAQIGPNSESEISNVTERLLIWIKPVNKEEFSSQKLIRAIM